MTGHPCLYSISWCRSVSAQTPAGHSGIAVGRHLLSLPHRPQARDRPGREGKDDLQTAEKAAEQRGLLPPSQLPHPC